MKCAVILLCAGKGERLKEKRDKAFVRIGRVPLFYYSYDVFSKFACFSQIIIVAGKYYFSLIKRYAEDRRVIVTSGGKRRQDSVYRGLSLVKPGVDYVFVHDGARPFVTVDLVKRVKDNVVNFGAVAPGIRRRDALKIARKEFIDRNLNGGNIWHIQTPQAFRRGLLAEAYSKFNGKDAYDDAEIVMRAGHRVKLIDGDYLNLKITYPEDLLLAKAILKVSHRL